MAHHKNDPDNQNGELDMDDKRDKSQPVDPLRDALERRVSTRSLGDTDFEEGRPQWGTARFDARMRLIVQCRDSKKKHVFYFDEIDELILGRYDPETGITPEIALDEEGAAEKGVSRRHAVIFHQDNALHVVDLGTPNGSYLNGLRLVANQPRVLRDGDELRLGHLVLRISFSHE